MVVPTGSPAGSAKILPKNHLSRKNADGSSSTAAASAEILPEKHLSGKNGDGSPTAAGPPKIPPKKDLSGNKGDGSSAAAAADAEVLSEKKHLSGRKGDGSPTAAADAEVLSEKKHLSGTKGDGSPTAAAASKIPPKKDLSGNNGDDSSLTAAADEISDGEKSLSLSEALYSKNYGAVPVGILMTVPVRPPRDRFNVADIRPEAAGRIVLVQGFAQAIKKVRKNLTLVILREGLTSIKCLLDGDDPGISNDMVSFVRKLNKDGFVEVEGMIETMHGSEQIRVRKLYCVDEASGLPFQLEDAARGAQEERDKKGRRLPHVSLSVRLNWRFFDLRVRATQAVFWVQSEVTNHFMQFMIEGGFMCTHTPKITGVSEGGSAVFKVNYFKEDAASLAQSPQLYKQILINGGINRVFEIGPVFRAEDSNTHRHLCEYIGLHAEMQIKEHYFEVIDFVDGLFVDIFDHLAKNCSEMLDIIQEQYPCERLKNLQQNVRLKYSEGIKMLQESGFPIHEPQDLNNKAELMLGKLVLEKYKTDFFILYEYPLALRPFYTMPSVEKCQPGSYSNSFDAFIRGQEVLSGSQRIHNKSLLIKRIDEWGYSKATFQQFTDTFGYVRSTTERRFRRWTRAACDALLRTAGY